MLSNPIFTAILSERSACSAVFGKWEHDGETQFASLWQLFLIGPLQRPRIDIIACNQAFAMRSGTDFSRIFIPAIVLVLFLVGFLSIKLIARSLIPLQHLTLAARQYAGGDLAARVRVRTGDEFEWLAEAFNNMAGRLGRQISALEAMSGIDRMILSGTKFEDVSEDVVGHLVELTSCQSASVIARDNDAPSKGIMISSCGKEFIARTHRSSRRY